MRENLDDKQILIFRVGPVVCCVDSYLVESIVHPQPLHRFPHQADFILGVLQYQNSAVSVVNLFHKFEVADPEPTLESRYIMGQTAKGTAGFWVDEVLEVTDQYEIHSAKPPEYSEQCVFESTVLWRDKLILKTDFTQLFMMSDAGPLQEWIKSDAGNAIATNYPNSTIEESDITAWTESINEASNGKIQALESRGVEFSQMVSFDKDASTETTIEDERKFIDLAEEAMTVSPLTDLSIVSAHEDIEKIIPESNFKVDIEIEKENVDSNLERSERNINQFKHSSEDSQVMEVLASQHGDSENDHTNAEIQEKVKVDSTGITVEEPQPLVEMNNLTSSDYSEASNKHKEVNTKKVSDFIETSKTPTISEPDESNILEEIDIKTRKSNDNHKSANHECKSQELSEFEISENLNLEALYEQRDIQQVEDSDASSEGNNEFIVGSEQDIPASLIENGDDLEGVTNLVQGSTKALTGDSQEKNVTNLILDPDQKEVSSICLSDIDELSNVQKTTNETKSSIQNTTEDEEVVEALAEQHNDSQDYKRTGSKKLVEKLSTTDMSVEDHPSIPQNSQESSIINHESFSASKCNVLQEHEINFTLSNESVKEVKNDSSIFGESDFKTKNRSKNSKNLLSEESTHILNEKSTGFSASIDGDSGFQRDSDLTIVDSNNGVSEDDTTLSDMVGIVDSKLENSLVEELNIHKIENSLSELRIDTFDNPELEQNSIKKAAQSTTIQKPVFESSKPQISEKPTIENLERVDNSISSSESDEERNTAKVLAAQYGDIDHVTTKSNEIVSHQNQIKQSQPEVFKHVDTTGAQLLKNSEKIVNKSTGESLVHHDFVKQSKADELTLSFINQDLTDSDKNFDIEPLTNLYTEFLLEPDEADPTELLLTRRSLDVEDISKRDSSDLNGIDSQVEQLSNIRGSSNAIELETSHTTDKQSNLEESTTNLVSPTLGNFDETVVVDDEVRKFKEDVETFFEENIREKVETYQQTDAIKSKKVTQLDKLSEVSDDFLDSIDDKLEEDKELQVTQDKAVGKIIERIERNRDGKDKTSPARVAASILICAILVFAIQHFWLNPTEEEIQVASLELLNELSFNTPIKTQTESVDDTILEFSQVSEMKGEVVSPAIVNPPERFSEISSNAIGGVDSKNAVSSKNLESVFNWKKHIIISGDTLWTLSERYLNDPFRYPDLARWSNIKNPDKIYPGNEVSYNTSNEAKNL